MSSHLYTHVGCFFKPPEVTSHVEIKKYACSNAKCKNHASMSESNKFCPICGSAGVQTITSKQVKQTPSYYGFAEDYGLDEQKLIDRDDCWMPNLSYEGVQETYCEYDGEGPTLLLDSKVIKESKAGFKLVYQDIMDKFQEIYHQKLIIHFGVKAFYN